MGLREYQSGMGEMVRSRTGDPLRGLPLDERERRSIEALRASAGFRVTVAIQRSWCEGRAARAAHLTLSALPEGQRKKLLAEWVDSGAGESSFFEAEAEEFLNFLAGRLAEGSEALTLCRMERATLRANAGKAGFLRTDASRLDHPGCVIRRGRFADLVCCEFEPRWALFGPGVEGLWRAASDREAALWERLVEPATVSQLSREGYGRRELAGLLDAGAMEIEEAKSQFTEKSFCFVEHGFDGPISDRVDASEIGVEP